MHKDTIAAISTAPGAGAIAIIRLSGENSIKITDKVFQSSVKDKVLSNQKTSTLHFGTIRKDDEIVDEVLVSIFRNPHSYTGEDSVEISCHGSVFIQQTILNLVIENGARTAMPGEFTQRAFLNGKMDLSQAEAVADLIASSSKAAHKTALQQMRGGFTSDLNSLRQQLLIFITLVELELDFSEEEVEFADREELRDLTQKIIEKVQALANSFELGNVIKKGVPVAIVGEPNVGKSTLLNVLLNEEKAIVSDIAGTTRDTIEDTITVGGVLFRFIDTAGIRKTEDTIEKLGIERTMNKIQNAEVVLLLMDASEGDFKKKVERLIKQSPDKTIIPVVNKSDLMGRVNPIRVVGDKRIIYISAKQKQGIKELESVLLNAVNYSETKITDTVITNTRHFELLKKAEIAAVRVSQGLLSGISGDFLAQDIREILTHIGEITGEVTDDEILGSIFSGFCIGK